MEPLLPEPVKKVSLYILFAALLGGTLWRGGYFPGPKLFLALMLLVAGAVELAVLLATGRKGALRSFALWSLVVFALYAVITRFWSADLPSTNRESLLLCGYLSAFFVVRSQLARAAGWVLGLTASWFVYTATFTAAWGLFAFLWRLGPYATMLDNVFRAGSTFEYSNALSCFSLMALPVTVALQRQSRERDRPLLAAAACLQAAAALISYARFGLVALVALTIYLVLSGWRGGFVLSTIFELIASVPIAIIATTTSESRNPLIGLTVATVILIGVYVVEYFMEKYEFRRVFVVVAGLAIACGLGVTAIMASRSDRMRVVLATRFQDGFRWSRLLPHRLDTWQGSIDSFRVRPVTGSGLGSFPLVYSQHTIAVYTKYAHNLVLQMAVDTGIIGAGLVLVFLVYITGLSLWRLFTGSKPLVRAFAVACLIFVAYNLFDWEWYVPALTAWFMVAAACLENVRGAASADEDVRGQESQIDDADDAVHGHEGGVDPG